MPWSVSFHIRKRLEERPLWKRQQRIHWQPATHDKKTSSALSHIATNVIFALSTILLYTQLLLFTLLKQKLLAEDFVVHVVVLNQFEVVSFCKL